MTKPSKHHEIMAKDIMSDTVTTVQQDMDIQQVAHLLLRQRISGVPVVEGDKVIGIITLTDLFHIMDKVYVNCAEDSAQALSYFKKMAVKEVMSKDVYSISPETTVHEIIRTVIQKKIHAFPVMKEGKLVGMIGRHDILNATFAYS